MGFPQNSRLEDTLFLHLSCQNIPDPNIRRSRILLEILIISIIEYIKTSWIISKLKIRQGMRSKYKCKNLIISFLNSI